MVNETSPLLSDPQSSSLHSSLDGNYTSGGLDNPNAAAPSWRRFSSRISDYVASHTGSIGMLGSMSIAVNSLTGPAMLNLPSTFERSGIIPTIACLVFVCILAALCCLHMSNTISKVPPNNANFKQEVEFSEAFREFWGPRWFLVTQVLFFCCITCLNISSIVDTSQVVDTFLGHWWPFGGANALLVSTDDVRWVQWDYARCTKADLREGNCIPFSDMDTDGSIVMTSGKAIVTLVFLPLALMDLKENSMGQIVGFMVLLLTSIQFVVQFALSDTFSLDNASWWGYDWDDLVGVVLFNFALVIAVPAWLYEREPHVDVATVIHSSSVMSLILYIAIGVLGNMAIPHASDNMLESMMSGTMGTLMQLGASVFAFMIIGLGIPLFSVLARLNLTGSDLCSRNMGNVLAVYFPFAIAWLLYEGPAVTKLLSWGGIVFTGLVAFLLPILLALHVVDKFDYEGSVTVYFGWFRSRRSEIVSLYVLLALTVAALAIAIAGNFVDMG